MNQVECKICGLMMKDINRVNGSHLKIKHGISIIEYNKIIQNNEIEIYIQKYLNNQHCTECDSNKHISEMKLNKNKFPTSKCKICYIKFRKRHRNYDSEKNRYYKQRRLKENPERVHEQKKKSYHKNIDSRKRYNKSVRKKINEQLAKRRTTDIQFKVKTNIRNRIKRAFKLNLKKSNTSELLGCTIVELRNHLELKFFPTMTWENYGKEWHIDHIIPCSSFDLTDLHQQKECFHYTNLQPLFATTRVIDDIEYIGNLNKHAKIYESTERIFTKRAA